MTMGYRYNEKTGEFINSPESLPSKNIVSSKDRKASDRDMKVIGIIVFGSIICLAVAAIIGIIL